MYLLRGQEPKRVFVLPESFSEETAHLILMDIEACLLWCFACLYPFMHIFARVYRLSNHDNPLQII